MSRLYAGIAIAAVVAVVGGTAAYVMLKGDQVAQCGGAQVAGGDIGGPFELVNSAGQTVTDEDVITEPALVYFGYTFCPDVCPLDSARNAEAVVLLEDSGIDVKPVFITVDPQRDTPEVVGDFAANFSDKMVGLTGSPEQVKAASQAYKTYYKVPASSADDEYYLVDHSTFTYLVLPDEGVVDFFRRDEGPEIIAERTACHLGA
ncbi:SCO family protein [Qingshengfaniella alkalisoli]|uniref:SCO family protein n=1 Tax=Qingshengfaniella alkalisoli TaxID=2599296 RepID=A0A5B8IWC7_9RHOB|nr:SCO family protein [Qingshengfaniella alkalisoli]QDY69964.1 SCO family protein [Qingshengfaniella alkalisoli]